MCGGGVQGIGQHVGEDSCESKYDFPPQHTQHTHTVGSGRHGGSCATKRHVLSPSHPSHSSQEASGGHIGGVMQHRLKSWVIFDG